MNLLKDTLAPADLLDAESNPRAYAIELAKKLETRVTEIRVTFPGGKRVNAALDGRIVQTDQSPEHGGEGSASEPFELFLASLATCAGLYVLGFCQARKLSTDGMEIVQRNQFDFEHRLTRVELDVTLPADFPEKYRVAVLRAAAGCKVKKALESPPAFVVRAKSAEGEILGTVGSPT